MKNADPASATLWVSRVDRKDVVVLAHHPFMHQTRGSRCNPLVSGLQDKYMALVALKDVVVCSSLSMVSPPACCGGDHEL